jgi:hypothetical protein
MQKKDYYNQDISSGMLQLRREEGNSDQFLCLSLRHVYESPLKGGGQRE